MIEFGIKINNKEVLSENAFFPIVLTELGIEMCVSCEKPANAKSPILSKDDGIFIEKY